MAFVVCVSPIGDHKPGDLIEIPDGAVASPMFFRPLAENETVSDTVPPALISREGSA